MNKINKTTHTPAITSQPAIANERDVSSKEVFKDPILCCQFLRDYVDIPLLKHVQPQDIMDVSARYQPYFGTEFEADTVKQIRLRDDQGNPVETPLFLIPLIEHKSTVDYNVAMQLLRYMCCIWHEYGKEMEKQQKGITKTKAFHYPPILPIVYYEGADRWTAPLQLRERIQFSEIFGPYIPDFTYQIVQCRDYSDEELLSRGNEMSLIMLLNKVQNADDIRKLRYLPATHLIQADKILENTPYHIKEIIQHVMYGLMMKMNLPVEEANEHIKFIEENRMGYLFENFEKFDIQEERRKVAEQRKLAEEQRQLAEEQRLLAEEHQRSAQQQRLRAEDAEQRLENSAYKAYISACRELDCSKEDIIRRIQDKYLLSYREASSKVEQFWDS